MPELKGASGSNSDRQRRGSPLVAVVILNWNGHEDTRLCLESLRLATYQPLRTIVVDNGSNIPGIEKVESDFPEIDVLYTGRNLGFSGGNNVGIRHALEIGAEFIAVLNNDTLVSRDFLEPIVTLLESDPVVGAASGTILQFRDEKTNIIWYAGGHLSKWQAKATLIGFGKKFRQKVRRDSVYTSFLSGCFFVSRSSVLRLIGFLDEDFFFGVEDLHMAWTLQNLGIGMCYVPQSVIWHRSGRSRQFVPDVIYAGYIAKILLIKKHWTALWFRIWLLGFSAYLLSIGSIAFFFRRKNMGLSGCRKRDVFAAMAKALADSWRGRLDTKPGTFQRRSQAGSCN